MEIRTGDVLLYRSNSLLSMIIRFFSGKYSHASIAFDSWYKIFIAEADADGVIPNAPDVSIKGCEILVLRPKFEFDAHRLDQLITSYLGKLEYNFFLLIITQLIWQISGKKIWIYPGRNSDKIKRVICGQFVALIWFEYFEGNMFKDWCKATPESLFESDLFEHFNLV